MSPDPERAAAERPAVVSFIPRTAGCVRVGCCGPDRQLIQVSLLAPRLTDALSLPGPVARCGVAAWTRHLRGFVVKQTVTVGICHRDAYLRL